MGPCLLSPCCGNLWDLFWGVDQHLKWLQQPRKGGVDDIQQIYNGAPRILGGTQKRHCTLGSSNIFQQPLQTLHCQCLRFVGYQFYCVHQSLKHEHFMEDEVDGGSWFVVGMILCNAEFEDDARFTSRFMAILASGLVYD